MARYFSAEQISLTGRAFAQAEKIAERYFRFGPSEWEESRYDLKTLAFLEEHEVRKGAFAHLCKYQSQKRETDGNGLHFYRICLQDDRILDAVERGNSFIRLAPLLLCILQRTNWCMWSVSSAVRETSTPPRKRSGTKRRRSTGSPIMY
jgi:hypothetical protein